MGGKIMVKVVTGFVIIIIITIIIAVNWAIKMSKAEHGDNPIILQSKEINPKKALVIYQPSLTKASYIVAHSIAQGLNDSGLEVTINYPGKHLSSDVSHYSVIAFGGPVYGGSVPKALIDYIERIEGFSNQRIVLFSTAGGGKEAPPEQKTELRKMEKLLNETKPFSTTRFNFQEADINKEEAYKLGTAAAKE